jgi:sugar (pentulose or hexulose) kinase
VALWARVCLGELTLTEAADLVPLDRTFTPNSGNRSEYDRLYAEYRNLYSRLRQVYGRLNGQKVTKT